MGINKVEIRMEYFLDDKFNFALSPSKIFNNRMLDLNEPLIRRVILRSFSVVNEVN